MGADEHSSRDARIGNGPGVCASGVAESPQHSWQIL